MNRTLPILTGAHFCITQPSISQIKMNSRTYESFRHCQIFMQYNAVNKNCNFFAKIWTARRRTTVMEKKEDLFATLGLAFCIQLVDPDDASNIEHCYIERDTVI